MYPRQIASDNQFMCYGGGGNASLPSNLTSESHQTSGIYSDPTDLIGNNRWYQPSEQARSSPGRGYGRSRGSSCPCPERGAPLATSSPIRGDGYRPRLADATFTIDQPQTGGFVLDETFTIEYPEQNRGQCPPNSPESSWSSGYPTTATPVRGAGRRPCPCPRPADATFTIDGPQAGGFVLDETYEAAPFALNETFTIEEPQQNRGQEIVQCPPNSPGSSWSSGYPPSPGGDPTSSSSDCPPPGFHPQLGQQYPPQRGNQGGCEFFLPLSPLGPPSPPPPAPPPVAWDIPWNPPPPLIPGLPRHPFPEPEPVSPVSRFNEPPPPRRRLLFQAPEDLAVAQLTGCWSELGVPPMPDPGMQRMPTEPDETEMIEPIMEGIQRMVEYGFNTLTERMQRVREMAQQMCCMRETQEEALQRVEDLRMLATANVECYLRQASNAWANMGEFYLGLVGFADNIPEGPVPCLQGLQQDEVVNQERYSELVRRAAIISRAINRELLSDSTLLGQLLATFENLEADLNRFQIMLPNFCRYIDWATQRTEVLQRFLTFSQCEFDQFQTAWACIERPNEPPLDESCEIIPPLDVVQDPHFANVTVSTETPTPPTSPRRGSWSPAVSPRGITNVLPRTPPDLPIRVQRWLSQAEGIPREVASEDPYRLSTLFEDYDFLEGQAVNELNSSNVAHALNESVNAMNRSQNSPD